MSGRAEPALPACSGLVVDVQKIWKGGSSVVGTTLPYRPMDIQIRLVVVGCMHTEGFFFFRQLFFKICNASELDLYPPVAMLRTM
jgi:hypothetical protein